MGKGNPNVCESHKIENVKSFGKVEGGRANEKERMSEKSERRTIAHDDDNDNGSSMQRAKTVVFL